MLVLKGEEPRRTQCAAVITAERLALFTAVAVHQVSAPFALTKKSRPTVFRAVPRHGLAFGPVGPRSTDFPTALMRAGVQ
jgi:hypothetical protein